MLLQTMRIMGGGGVEAGGGAYKHWCLKSSGTLPKFSSANFFFLQIGLTVEINLTAKKLSKIAIRTTSRTAELAVCKRKIYNFSLASLKIRKKRPNKQGCMTEAAVFQCFPAVLGYLGYVELISLLTNLFYVVSGLLPC